MTKMNFVVLFVRFISQMKPKRGPTDPLNLFRSHKRAEQAAETADKAIFFIQLLFNFLFFFRHLWTDSPSFRHPNT